jgi:micrococcal nuclease
MENLNIKNCPKFSFCGCKFISKVVNVIDGDTISGIVEVYPQHFRILNFRLHGINAPELSGTERPYGLESKVHLIHMITGISKDDISKMSYSEMCKIFNGDKTFYVFIECVDEHDKYGRVLARIYEDDDFTISYNDKLVYGGYANIYA